jgi:hypothetical protein
VPAVPSRIVLEIPAAEQAHLLRQVRRARWGSWLMLHIVLLLAQPRAPSDSAGYLLAPQQSPGTGLGGHARPSDTQSPAQAHPRLGPRCGAAFSRERAVAVSAERDLRHARSHRRGGATTRGARPTGGVSVRIIVWNDLARREFCSKLASGTATVRTCSTNRDTGGCFPLFGRDV